jgi:hypothetical protein
MEKVSVLRPDPFDESPALHARRGIERSNQIQLAKADGFHVVFSQQETIPFTNQQLGVILKF